MGIIFDLCNIIYYNITIYYNIILYYIAVQMIALNFKMSLGIEFYNYVYYITHTRIYVYIK